MKFCFWFWHDWRRYSELVKQDFVGEDTYCAWQRCRKCKKRKFDQCDRSIKTEVQIF